MKNDPVFTIIKQEEKRQSEGLELIPSENYVSKEVLQAMGSVLTNKYSEGYPGKRYYGGNENIDEIENLAIDRAKELFHADHANARLLARPWQESYRLADTKQSKPLRWHWRQNVAEH